LFLAIGCPRPTGHGRIGPNGRFLVDIEPTTNGPRQSAYHRDAAALTARRKESTGPVKLYSIGYPLQPAWRFRDLTRGTKIVTDVEIRHCRSPWNRSGGYVVPADETIEDTSASNLLIGQIDRRSRLGRWKVRQPVPVRTSWCRVTIQAVPPPARATLLTGSSIRSRTYSCGGSCADGMVNGKTGSSVVSTGRSPFDVVLGVVAVFTRPSATR
jgi:hypothetical protein